MACKLSGWTVKRQYLFWPAVPAFGPFHGGKPEGATPFWEVQRSSTRQCLNISGAFHARATRGLIFVRADGQDQLQLMFPEDRHVARASVNAAPSPLQMPTWCMPPFIVKLSRVNNVCSEAYGYLKQRLLKDTTLPFRTILCPAKGNHPRGVMSKWMVHDVLVMRTSRMDFPGCQSPNYFIGQSHPDPYANGVSWWIYLPRPS